MALQTAHRILLTIINTANLASLASAGMSAYERALLSAQTQPRHALRHMHLVHERVKRHFTLA
jgi:hypothetical protein